MDMKILVPLLCGAVAGMIVEHYIGLVGKFLPGGQ